MLDIEISTSLVFAGEMENRVASRVISFPWKASQENGSLEWITRSDRPLYSVNPANIGSVARIGIRSLDCELRYYSLMVCVRLTLYSLSLFGSVFYDE